MLEFSSRERALLHTLFSSESIAYLVQRFPDTTPEQWETIYSKIVGRHRGSLDLIIYVDGAADPRNHTAGVGGIIYRKGNESNELFSFSENIGKATNNEAEYIGLLRGLEFAAQLGCRHVTVYSDSQLVVRQLNLEFKVKNDRLLKLHEKCRSLLGNFDTWKVEHISRGRNTKADNLSKQALVKEKMGPS